MWRARAGLGATAIAAGFALAGALPAAAAPTGADAVSTAAVGSPLRVMPLGDSITMGIGSATMSSYRIDLQKRLAGAGMDVDFVGSQQHGSPATADLDHEGHSGWTVAKIAANVDGWLTTYQPDAVLLMIGTNDLRTEAGSVGATERLSALVDQITVAAPATELFVAKITGTRTAGNAPQQKRTDAYNARIPGIVAAKGAHVHLVDQSTVRRLDIRDGLHPNDFGFAKMSWNWYQAMQKVYHKSGTAWPASDDPFATTKANMCHLVDGDPGPKWVAFFDCRWWYKNLVPTTINGKTTKVWTWQTKRYVSESYRVNVNGHWEDRTRRVSKWFSGVI
ncbi:SGNH/GDSL hydrolase family protein [Actinoplanes sp. NPDC026619]|uniref:SGNH/GDSL hydrolase family protein n=1 Tax=Actinoplanes sp. NPDC026619 TaxID=3155798 RepID=UPI0033CA45A9